ncbi:MAG: hypothetical protein NTV62_03445, partial [Candidatus Gribaldobacteria bacterium]|nr:hypothetical protein [Candidatus Gribaldobacteria bacterium]
MGKKSRFKKQRQQVNGSDKDVLVQERQQQLSLVEKIARYLVIAGIYLSTLTPLILLNQFYFPFVGIKSLYFMGCAQLVFFAWLLLAILNKSYRPKWNAVLIAFLLYIVAITVSSLVGVDFSHSFWSKFERMTGLLVWLHIFAFFVALFSFFKTQKDWKNFFLASVFVSGVVALFSTLESMGVSKFNLFAKSYTDIKDNVLFVGLKSLVMADRGGLTLGNTSFLGAYLMFNLFLAIYLGFTNLKLLFAKNIKIVLQALALVVFSIGLLRFYQDYRLISDNLQVFATSSNLFGNLVIAGFGLLAFILLSVGVRFFSVGVVLIMIASLYFNEARAALGGVLVGAGAILLLWLSFSDKSEKIYKKQARSLGIIALAIFILGSLALWLVKKDLIINILNVLGKFNLQGFFYLLTGLVVGLGVWLIIGSWKVSRFVKITKNIGRAILALATIVFVVCLVLLFLPNNPIHNLFGQMGGNARFVNWSIAQQGFLERPITGWGPENYILAFPKFFNSCLFIPGECGGEIWFDRAHNIIMDNLVTAGLVGSLTYLGIFIVAFVFLALAYLKYKRVSIWEFAVFTAVLISYFLQNLTVFDMATSLMMFAVILAFIAFSVKKENTDQSGLKLVRNFPTGSLILIVGLFAICFLLFINQPIKSDGGVIKALTKEQEIASYARQLKNSNPQAQGNALTNAQEADFVNFVITKRQEELTEMKAGLNASPMGKYQIREFFAQQFETAIRE